MADLPREEFDDVAKEAAGEAFASKIQLQSSRALADAAARDVKIGEQRDDHQHRRKGGDQMAVQLRKGRNAAQHQKISRHRHTE